MTPLPWWERMPKLEQEVVFLRFENEKMSEEIKALRRREKRAADLLRYAAGAIEEMPLAALGMVEVPVDAPDMAGDRWPIRDELLSHIRRWLDEGEES